MFEHKPFNNGQLAGHESEETAYVINEYPYGYSMRTTIRYWIETTKNGQRRVSQTINPKTGKWNAPKKSTYDDISVMGLDEKGYVAWDGIKMGCDEQEVASFETAFPVLTDCQKKQLLLIKGFARGQKYIKYTVTSGTLQDMQNKPRQTEKEQREIVKTAALAGLTEVIRETREYTNNKLETE